MKTRIFNLIILDESGSMIAIKKEAIDSMNETIQTIRQATQENEQQEHFVSLTTFNTKAKINYECVNVNEVEELTSDTYLPDGCTALYDAMGMTLTSLRPKVSENDKVLVTIITDGMENASQEYNSESIKTLVDELKSKGWVFAYIGTNHDVGKTASAVSIENVMRFHPDAVGCSVMAEKLCRARKRLYSKFAQSSDKDYDYAAVNRDFFKED